MGTRGGQVVTTQPLFPSTTNAYASIGADVRVVPLTFDDETYRAAAYGDDPVAATAVDLGPEVVTVASLSKCHGAAALRIGWIVSTDADLVDQLKAALDALRQAVDAAH